MPSCLGIHIENDVIKYAKVRKEKELIKVEAFNVIFYDDLKATIKKIITETNSHKIPISINLGTESYNYFEISSLMNKSDMKKAAVLDFEYLCEERNIKKNTLETRFLFAPSIESNEKMQAIAISGNQADIAQKKMNFENVKIATMHPLSTSITNLINPSEKAKIAIVNIEEKTKLTIMSDGEIVAIDVIEEGMKDIINKINMIENSKQKSYEVCKNTTLYSQDTEGNMQEGNEYLDSILPTLYTIITKTKEKIEDTGINISKIYISGLATSINNIDLYFQEYFEKSKCEILKPFFANVSSIKTSIKEYIEVNSAIALAMDGIGYGYRELNFVGNGNVNGKMLKSSGKKSAYAGKTDFSGPLSVIEKTTIRISITALIALLLFIIASSSISNQLDNKYSEIEQSLVKIDTELNKIDSDISKVESETEKYKQEIEVLNSLEDKLAQERIIKKGKIPTLLNNIAAIIPTRVQIITIQNEKNSTHMVIEAQSPDYDQLGYLKAAIATGGYLQNVKSTSGTKNGDIITTIIEGDLP